MSLPKAPSKGHVDIPLRGTRFPRVAYTEWELVLRVLSIPPILLVAPHPWRRLAEGFLLGRISLFCRTQPSDASRALSRTRTLPLNSQ